MYDKYSLEGNILLITTLSLRLSKFNSPPLNCDQGQYVGCPDSRGEETDGVMFDKWSFSTTQ